MLANWISTQIEMSMLKTPSSYAQYGKRSRFLDNGNSIRHVSPTFGKERRLIHDAKSNTAVLIESDAERILAKVLNVDPQVKAFVPQPFSVDLIDGRICRDKKEIKEARARHKGRLSPRFYTPDFFVEWHNRVPLVIEVKLEGFSGDDEYQIKLDLSQSILTATGYQFARITIPKSHKWPLRSNLPLLSQAALRRDHWPIQASICAIESACGDGLSLNQLCQKLRLSPNLVPIWLISGVLRADLLNQEINGDMHLSPSFGDLSHLHLLAEILK